VFGTVATTPTRAKATKKVKAMKKAIATKKNWSDVVKVIDSLNVKYTDEQLQHVKDKQWV